MAKNLFDQIKIVKEDLTTRFYVISITLITLFGIYFRLKGLGLNTLAIDEYYSYSAVRLLLENGVPQFLCGGFYTRGILLQYLTAPFVYLLNNQELASRLPIFIFSILGFPAVYLIGRDSHNKAAGVVALFLFAFSIWQIEFSRFARMYVPFQTVFLWQVWLFIKPNIPSRKSNILLNAGLTLAAVLIYAGGIFCVALAMLNIVIHQKSFKITEYLSLSLAAFIAVIFRVVPFRFLGSDGPLPLAHSSPSNAQTKHIETTLSTTHNLPIELPNSIIYLDGSYFISIILITYILISMMFMYQIFKNKNIKIISKLILIALIISLIHNQYLLAPSLILILLLIELDSIKNIINIFQNKIGILLITFTGIWIISSTAYFIQSHSGLNVYELAKALYNSTLSYPDIYFVIIRQWQKAMPVNTIILFIALGLITSLTIFKIKTKNKSLQYLLICIITMLILAAAIKTPYNISRYTFFIYPLLLVTGSIIIVYFANLAKSRYFALFISMILLGSICYASEDYKLKHLFLIDSYEINHRVPYSKEVTRHLYPRYDYLSLADYLNKNAKMNDTIIVSTPVIEHYINNELKLKYFIAQDNIEFSNHSACNAQHETWSGLPLIYSYELLDNIIKNNDSIIWFIGHDKRGNPFTSPQLNQLENNIKPYYFMSNPDKTLSLYKITNGRFL